jgi:hypothetical protein
MHALTRGNITPTAIENCWKKRIGKYDVTVDETKFPSSSSLMGRRKLFSFLRPIKDGTALKTPGADSILCERGKMYMGQTERLIEMRFKKHRHIVCTNPRHLRWLNTALNLGHQIHHYSGEEGSTDGADLRGKERD